VTKHAPSEKYWSDLHEIITDYRAGRLDGAIAWGQVCKLNLDEVFRVHIQDLEGKIHDVHGTSPEAQELGVDPGGDGEGAVMTQVKARNTACEVINELRGRAGFDSIWDDLDRDIRMEIEDAITSIIYDRMVQR
jgi:hypothetical protein